MFILCPPAYFSVAFLCQFWRRGFFLAASLSNPGDVGHLILYVRNLVPDAFNFFTSSLGFYLKLLDKNVFISGSSFVPASWLMQCLGLHTTICGVFSCPMDQLDVCRVTVFLGFSNDIMCKKFLALKSIPNHPFHYDHWQSSKSHYINLWNSQNVWTFNLETVNF